MVLLEFDPHVFASLSFPATCHSEPSASQLAPVTMIARTARERAGSATRHVE